MLLVRAKIVQPDGNNIADTDPVRPVNLWLHSLFSQVDISLSVTQVTTSTNTYPFCAMIETHFSAMVMRPKCRNLRHHYFTKISPEGWTLWTLLMQHTIEAFGIDLNTREVVALSI